ncbi:MAG: fused MFS/spermidine synthase [Nitrospinae bacterium]|nr:fused MFS/spermidine synthase [Nitrospinota bacterium]MBL7019831.1 fused MFS/spermidine synthase [Nitrospinaceae bacterium]
MGNTHYSISTVLTAFMGGLALGSYAGGKLIDRKFNSLTAYAFLEAGIGLYCLLIPSLIDLAFPIFKWIYLNLGDSYTQASLARFLVCVAILILPATFMGATLPVLSKYISQDEAHIGKDVGTLYSINTFGAVFGAWASAFIFMRLWGVQSTIWMAALLNLAISAVIFLVFRPPLKEKDPAEPERVLLPLDKREKFILLSFGISGMVALVYQVAWNRILSLLLGSSVYAFSLILSVFILGLAFGTASFSRLLCRFSDFMKVYGITQIVIGLFALSIIPLFGYIPFANRWIYENWGLQFESVQLANFLIIFVLIVIPTFFMGAQFPLVIKLTARKLETLGRHVGRAYACNTIGAIVGSFVAGFILIPELGLQTTLMSGVFLNILLGIAILALGSKLNFSMKVYALPAVLMFSILAAKSIGPWDKSVISSGSFMPYRIADLKEAELKKNKILFFKEGMHTTVTTELSVSGNIFLRVNGKTDASLALDMRTQLLSGYLPMLFHPDPESALVIGQGSGITLGAVEQFSVKKITLVEISPSVIEGSRFFDPFNHQALDDKRVTLKLEDGRNHIALSDDTYDVIVSEPSNPWISGVGALFTVNFFELLKKRLNPGGVACIWVHTNMSPDSFKSIIRSFSKEFPFVSMWESIAGDDYLLIGSEKEYGLSYEKARQYLSDEVVGRDLHRIGINNVPDLLSLMIMSREKLLEFSASAPLHTDDNSLLEFNAPEYVYKDERAVLVRQLTPFIKLVPEFVTFADASVREKVMEKLVKLQRSESQIEDIKKKAGVERLLDEALEAFNVGDISGALQRYQKILALDSEHVMTYYNMANIFLELKLMDKAESAYRKTLEINPFYVFGSIGLARLHVFSGQPDKAIEVLHDTLKWYGGDHEVSLYLGLAYAFKQDSQKAIEELKKSLQWDPTFPPAHYYLGVQYQSWNPRLAKKHLQIFLKQVSLRPGYENLQPGAEKLLNKL